MGHSSLEGSMELIPLMRQILIRPIGPHTLVVVCSICVTDVHERMSANLMTETNTGYCDCGEFGCLVEWALAHLVEYHVKPHVVTRNMEPPCARDI